MARSHYTYEKRQKELQKKKKKEEKRLKRLERKAAKAGLTEGAEADVETPDTAGDAAAADDA